MKHFFKKLSGALLVTLIGINLLTTGCKDDDKSADPIVGTWKLYEVEQNDGTILTPTEFGVQLTIVFTTSDFVATWTEKGEQSIHNGTWSRTNSSNVVLSESGSEYMSLTKNEESYTTTWENNDLLKFIKQ